MKNILGIIIWCSISLFCVSCFEEKDFGFPKEVTFPKEGGVTSIFGNTSFTHASIQDYKGNHGSIGDGEDGKEYVEYEWLKVEYDNPFSDVLKIYVEPNTTGKSRKLYIELYSGPEYHVTKVKQY